MIVKKLSNRESILILLSFTFVWLAGIRFYLLPALQIWNDARISSDRITEEEVVVEMDTANLKAEIDQLEKRLKDAAMEEISFLSISNMHLILAEMNTVCGGELLEIDMICLEKDPTQLSLRFIWQGEYDEWMRSLVFLDESPWIFDKETVLLRSVSISNPTLLQWEFQCVVVGKYKSRIKAEESTSIIEEGRNPFEIK